MMIYLIATLLVALNTAGQLLLKKAAMGKGFKSLEIWLGYFCFFTTVLISFALMRHVDLKYLIVVMNLNYVAVMLASACLFTERLNSAKIFGTALVLSGAVLFVGV